MKAILDHDRIVRFTIREIGIEVGSPPKGVGLERLRWDGEKIVDLNDLTLFHVEHQNGIFILHVIEIPKVTTPISMSYADRRKLVIQDQTIFLQTDEQITQQKLSRDSLNELLQTRKAFFIEELLETLQVMIRYMGTPTQTDKDWLTNRYTQITNLLNKINNLKANIQT